MSREYVHVEREGAVALVVMDNPASLNAMDEDLGPQLARALEGLALERAARAVVLSGAGGVFSGGGNMARAHEHLKDHEGAGELFAAYTKWVQRVVAALTGMPQPVVCAVEGASSGAGLGWMLASDFVICDEAAKLVAGFLAIGLGPGAGVSLNMARRLGLARTSELLYLNRRLEPREALAWGLVDELRPAEEVLPRALELAAHLARGPAQALAAAKALLNAASRRGLLTQCSDERRVVMELADLPEFRRRVARFMGGRRD